MSASIALGMLRAFSPDVWQVRGSLQAITSRIALRPEKRLELLRDFVPKGRLFGLLINPANVNAQNDTRILSQAGRKLGLEIAFQHAGTADEINRAKPA
jgi:hypothetical protein